MRHFFQCCVVFTFMKYYNRAAGVTVVLMVEKIHLPCQHCYQQFNILLLL